MWIMQSLSTSVKSENKGPGLGSGHVLFFFFPSLHELAEPGPVITLARGAKPIQNLAVCSIQVTLAAAAHALLGRQVVGYSWFGSAIPCDPVADQQRCLQETDSETAPELFQPNALTHSSIQQRYV